MLMPISKFAEKYPWPSKGRMSWIIWSEEKNGTLEWVSRYGRRVLIDPDLFFDWVKKNGKK